MYIQRPAIELATQVPSIHFLNFEQNKTDDSGIQIPDTQILTFELWTLTSRFADATDLNIRLM